MTDKEKRDAVVHAFAAAMIERLDEKAAEGYTGWAAAYPENELRADIASDSGLVMLGGEHNHTLADIANRCMMLWYRTTDSSFFDDDLTCRVCGCTEHDCSQCIEKTGKPCHWVEDDLCSACAPKKLVLCAHCGLTIHKDHLAGICKVAGKDEFYCDRPACLEFLGDVAT